MTETTRVNDLQLAAYVLALGHRLVAVEGPATRREFIFADVPKDVVIGFYSGAAPIDARQLFSCWRDLRGLAAQTL